MANRSRQRYSAQRQAEEAIRRETERRADEIVRKMAENKPDLPDGKTELAVRGYCRTGA